MTVRTILNDELVLEARTVGSLVAYAVMRFCRSASTQVEPWHVQPPKMICERDCADTAALLAPIAQSHWDQVVSPSTHVPLSHDAYLKAWALKAPSISADFILFDEAQDADAVMLDVLKRQSAQVVYVGDPYQQIYEWRGAINALDTVAAQQSFLTQSFRFGPELARSANDFLDLLGATKPLVGYEILKTRVDWEPSEAPVDAILCRTNASGVAHGVAAMAAGLSVCLQVNGSEILAFADAAEALQQGRKPSDSEYAAFKHWSELVEFSETKAGSEYAPYVKLVNEHGVALLREVIHASVPHQKAQITISTAHRAKGLEWNRVRLADDFRLGAMTAEGYKLNESEARLDYVALTRAKAYVDASSLAGLLEEAQRELGCSAY